MFEFGNFVPSLGVDFVNAVTYPRMLPLKLDSRCLGKAPRRNVAIV